MHRLLKRQVKKLLGDECLKDEKLTNFLEKISEFYYEVDKEKKLLENALEVNSRELTEYADKLHSMAFYDSLTGLTNRKLFEKEVDNVIKQIHKDKKNVALLFIDLDDFKKINDTFGHDIGDKLLVEFGKIVKSKIGKSDILSRWGGDEFLLLLDNFENIQECTTVVKSIQEAFKEPINLGRASIKISFSIGISLYEDGQDVVTMIKNADIAMYQAKESGKNKYSFYK